MNYPCFRKLATFLLKNINVLLVGHILHYGNILTSWVLNKNNLPPARYSNCISCMDNWQPFFWKISTFYMCGHFLHYGNILTLWVLNKNYLPPARYSNCISHMDNNWQPFLWKISMFYTCRQFLRYGNQLSGEIWIKLVANMNTSQSLDLLPQLLVTDAENSQSLIISDADLPMSSRSHPCSPEVQRKAFSTWIGGTQYIIGRYCFCYCIVWLYSKTHHRYILFCIILLCYSKTLHR